MIFGDRWNMNNGPRFSAVKESKHWIDITIIHFYGYYEEKLHRGTVQKEGLDLIYKITGKPIILGDFAFSVPTPEMPDPCGPQGSGISRVGTEKQLSLNITGLSVIL